MAAKKATKKATKSEKKTPGRKSLITNVGAMKTVDRKTSTIGQLVGAFQKATGMSEGDAREALIRQGFGRYLALGVFK